MIKELFIRNLDIIFLLYGAAFFCMGVAILSKRPSKESAFKLAEPIWLLAAFGIIHGINEWFELVMLIKGYTSTAWNISAALILTLSYIVLFIFGLRLCALHTNKSLNKLILPFISLIVILLIFISDQPASIWPRYFLGLPAGVLCAFGFYLYYRDNKKILKLLKSRRYFLTAAIACGVYSILGGLITPKANFYPACIFNYIVFFNFFGIPVQLLRAVCAIILSWAVYNILAIFTWESISHFKSALEEVTSAKNYINNILKSISDTLIVIDPSSKIKFINNAGCQILGYQPEEIIGKPATKLFKKGTLLKNKILRNLIKKESLNNYEIDCITKGKVKVPMLFSGSIMKNKNGGINGIVAIGTDLRNLKNLQEKLISAEKFAVMGKVSGIIGHELRNQLAVMRNAAYYIKMKLTGKPDTEEKIIKNLNALDNEIKEADQLIDNILTFSKTKLPDLKPVDLKKILLRNIEKIVCLKETVLTTEIDKFIPEILADELQISRVFINIILNALEAMGNVGALAIIMKVSDNNNYITIRFEDSGPGIKDGDKEKIFEPFFSTKEKGTGLGLATSKLIIEAHGGSISAENNAVKGAAIIVKLPVKLH